MYGLRRKVFSTFFCFLGVVYTFDNKLMGFHKTDKNLNLVLNTLFTVHARSRVECGKKCLASNCSSFSYTKQSQSCDI
ncbi:hypothetical protein BgiMline_036323, partial [Biomphalaria glabrata]